MLLLSDILHFAHALVNHLFALITGGAIAFIVAAIEHWRGRSISRSSFVALVMCSVLAASFLSWRDQTARCYELISANAGLKAALAAKKSQAPISGSGGRTTGTKPPKVVSIAQSGGITAETVVTANTVNVGPPDMEMSAEQQDSITSAMKPFGGQSVSVFGNMETSDSYQFREKLSEALTRAGIKVDSGSGMRFGGPVPEGVSLSLNVEDQQQTSMANVLAIALIDAGLAKKPIPASPGRAPRLMITIAPRRH